MWITTAWSEKSNPLDMRVFRIGRAFRRSDAERLAKRIVELAAGGTNDFIVDLTDAEALDPHAVTPIVRAARELEGREVRISAVVDPSLSIFQVEGLEALSDVAVTEDDAVARLSCAAAASDD